MIKKLILYIVILGTILSNGYCQPKSDSTMWCFNSVDSKSIFTPRNVSQLSVRYIMANSTKWKKVAQQHCYYGFQPELSSEALIQIALPKKIIAFEVSFYNKNEKYTLLIDDIPDSISKYSMVLLDDITLESRQSQYKLRDFLQIKVAMFLNKDVDTIDEYHEKPRVQSDYYLYQVKSNIKIYIESAENKLEKEALILHGCGTPGSLYIVQQWINGEWVDSQNKWSVKCAPQKFKVNKYIVGLTIDKVGVFRVLFDDRSSMNYSKPYLVSNPFTVK